MSRHISTLNLHLEPADNQRLASLCGPFDDNLKQLERRLGIEISYRDNHFQVIGKQAQVEAAAVILKHLYVETQPLKGSKVSDITPEMVHLAVQESRVLEQDDEPAPSLPYGKEVTVKTKRGLIKPRSPNQAQYIANIVRHDISFGIGPAVAQIRRQEPQRRPRRCLRAPEQQEVETQVEVLAERDRRLVETMARLIDLSIQYPRCKRKPELSGQHRIPMAPDPVLRATGA